MLSEVNDLAGQHEVVAEQLSASVASDITAVIKELKDERKRVSPVTEPSRGQSEGRVDMGAAGITEYSTRGGRGWGWVLCLSK